jgi:hypothetical protein
VAEHAGGRPGAQHLDVVDAVATGEQAVHHRQDLAARSGGTGPLAEVDQLVGGLLDPEPVSERGGQQQARIGDHALVIERDMDLVQHDRRGSHRRVPPAQAEWLGSQPPSSQARRPFSQSRPPNQRPRRWIEAQRTR